MRGRAGIFLLLLLMGAFSCSRDPDTLKRRYVETGNKYFDRGKYKEASIMYRSALNKDKLYGEAYYRLGLAQLKLKEHIAASRSFRRAVELQPDNEDAKAKLADIYLVAYLSDPRKPKEIRQEIKELAEQLLQKNPKSFDGLRLAGYLAWTDGDMKAAVEKFRGANAVKAFDADLILAFTQVLAEDGQFEEAEGLAKGLIAQQKSFAPIYDVLYLQYARRDRLEDAENIRKLKVENNPKEAQYRLQLAQHYYLTQRRDEAARTLERMISSPEDFPKARLNAGDFYARLREFGSAIRHYQEGARSGEPEDKLVYQRRIADVMIVQGRKQEAAKFVDELLQEHPKDPALTALRASLLLDVGSREQIQTAVTELQAAVTNMPNNPVVRFNLGRAHWAKGEIEQAQTQFREAVKLRPDYLAPRQALAQVHLNKGEWGAALQVANETLGLSPGDLTASLLRASALLGMGNNNQARAELQATVNKNPNSLDALLQLGSMELYLKNYAEAEKIFSRCRDPKSADVRCFLGLAESYAARQQYDRSIDLLQKEIQRLPERRELKLALANVAVQAAKYEMAVPLYSELIAAEPQSSDLHLKLGETYRRMGNMGKAVEFFRKGKDLNPKDAGAYFPLALLLDAGGQRKEAMALYDQALKLQPDNPVALNNLAYLLAESGGDLDLALTYAQRAKQKLPHSPDVSDTLGWIYIKKNLSANAVEIYADLVAKHPANSTFRYHMAMALFQMGDKPGAKKELQAALRNNPPKDEEDKIRQLMARIG